MDVLNEVQDLLTVLTRTQAKIAKYILNNPETICFSSLKKVAEDIGVTETTVLSFCKKTEAGSFAGLKKAIHSYLQERLFWNSKLEMSSQQYDADELTLDGLKENQRQLLGAAMEGLDTGALLAFVDTLCQAENIYICGHSASLTIAANLQHKLRDTGALTRLVDVSDYGDVLDALTRFDDKDVFILITLPFYSAQTVAISEYLHSRGATVLAMTDKAASPLVCNARHVLLCRSNSMIFDNSIASMIAMADIIASVYILRNKEKFERHNQKIKEIEGFFQTSTIPAYDNEYYFYSWDNDENSESK